MQTVQQFDETIFAEIRSRKAIARRNRRSRRRVRVIGVDIREHVDITAGTPWHMYLVHMTEKCLENHFCITKLLEGPLDTCILCT